MLVFRRTLCCHSLFQLQIKPPKLLSVIWNLCNVSGVVFPNSGVRRKFSWGGFSFSGIWQSFLFGVRRLWRHNLTSYSYLQTNVLTKFVDIIYIFFYTYTHSPYSICHCTEYILSALQVRISEENELNATTQQFLTAKNREVKHTRLRAKTGK